MEPHSFDGRQQLRAKRQRSEQRQWNSQGRISKSSSRSVQGLFSDGIDILSVSIGRIIVPNVNDMLTNSVSIGSFHAVSRGIIVVASAGNDGPEPEIVTNVAPWVFTIASGSIDREFSNNIILSLAMANALRNDSFVESMLRIALNLGC
ncbi:hypothetical protein K1719_014924 [Acacia pycnantha]|nr:hypothetical protein K1719_014924 [Acacia pycnantha]